MDNSKICNKRRKCKIYDGKHPTVLHGLEIKKKDKNKHENNNEENKEVKSNDTGVNCASLKVNQIISMCVVPVQVRLKGSGSVVETWAMLDNCSQGSFVKTNLLKELKVQGINTSVTIKTLNGDFKHSTRVTEGLEVSNAYWKKEEWVSLLRMFSQNELPTELDEIATPENIKQWEYLHRIIPEMKASGNLDIQLLIGANCLKALEPQEVVTSKGDGPHALRTKLGWCIVGPIAEKRQENRFHCNRISVKDCRTGNSSRHHFAISECKEEGIGDLLKRMYDTDFMQSQVLPENGIHESLSELSVEDLSFLKSMEENYSRYENTMFYHYLSETRI